MGTKMAPAYASTFMGRLEGQLLRSVALRPYLWFKFIDDIDMKWLHGRETLATVLGEANNFHPNIKFTAEISNKQHVFLDTKTSFVGDTISVDLFTKPTDTHEYPLPTLPPETLLQKCSLQPCTSPQTYLLRFGHL